MLETRTQLPSSSVTAMHTAPAADSGKKPGRLADAVVEEISRRIHAEELHDGDKLPTEAELMRTMGVSRTVIRESLSRLQASGMVTTRQGIGTFVTTKERTSPAFGLMDPSTLVTLRDVIALMELRVSLETEAAALAAIRRTEAHIAAMRAAVDAFARGLVKGEKAVQPDVDFHQQIALATGNRYFLDVYASLGTTTVPRTRIDTALLAEQQQEHYLTRTNHEHEDILNAIIRQDPEGARAGMRTHLVNSIERLKRVADAATGTQS